MSPHHSDQMSQRSQVSRVALFLSRSKVLSESVSDSVSDKVTYSGQLKMTNIRYGRNCGVTLLTNGGFPCKQPNGCLGSGRGDGGGGSPLSGAHGLKSGTVFNQRRPSHNLKAVFGAIRRKGKKFGELP